MSFETKSKLELERKMQLAAELGLQPRHVAVWFQNFWARWKTKQLERDYDDLKQQYEEVVAEKKKFEGQVKTLQIDSVSLKEKHGCQRIVKYYEEQK